MFSTLHRPSLTTVPRELILLYKELPRGFKFEFCNFGTKNLLRFIFEKINSDKSALLYQAAEPLREVCNYIVNGLSAEKATNKDSLYKNNSLYTDAETFLSAKMHSEELNADEKGYLFTIQQILALFIGPTAEDARAVLHSRIFYALAEANSVPILYQQGLDCWFDDRSFSLLCDITYAGETPDQKAARVAREDEIKWQRADDKRQIAHQNAIFRFEKAAKGNFLPAILLLAECYEVGDLTPKSAVKARAYYQQALGHADLACIKHIVDFPSKLRAKLNALGENLVCKRQRLTFFNDLDDADTEYPWTPSSPESSESWSPDSSDTESEETPTTPTMKR